VIEDTVEKVVPDTGLVAVATAFLAVLNEPDWGDLYSAFDHAFETALTAPDVDLSQLDAIPELAAIHDAAQRYATSKEAQRKAADNHATWLASLPTAAELMAEVNASEGSYDFHGYTLWRECDGWSLTNAYGVDNCAFLAREGHFEWLLESVRKGEDLGPVPPYCQDPDDDDRRSPEDDRFDACDSAALLMLERLWPDSPTDDAAAESLFSLALNARVESALMWLLVTSGDVGTEAFDRHRSDAWAFAERAGYLFSCEPMPHLLQDDTELQEAWTHGSERREADRKTTAAELDRVRHGLLRAISDSTSRGSQAPQ
jgi:hypothetical protein